MINAEIITIGNEIIYGDILNTNSAFISSKLKNAGIHCNFHSSMGDNFKDIADAIHLALERSDLIIITGGLGPTDDDITIECASKALGLQTEFREDIFENIKELFKKFNKPMSENNKRQAFVPQGAIVFKNESGTAPMSIVKKDNKHLVFMPGVPSEVEYFVESHLFDFINSLCTEKIVSRMLKFHNLSESEMNEMILPVMSDSEVEIAFLPKRGEARLKLTAQSKNLKEANCLLDKKEKEILSIIGKYFYGKDNEEIENILARILIENNLSVSTAESCTGGLISKYLTDVAGSSAYVKLNVVTYANEAKIKILGVNKTTLELKGAVSEEVAKQMAEGIKNLAQTDYSVSTTGIAGPGGGSVQKPVGLVYISVCGKKGTYVLEKKYPSKLPRKEIRTRAATHALHFLREIILKESAL